MSKSIILSIRYSENQETLEINLIAPDLLVKSNVKDLPQPEQGIINNIAVAMEWLKIHARKQNLTSIVRINEKIILTENNKDYKNI